MTMAGPVIFVAPVREEGAPAGGQVRAATLFAEALGRSTLGREGRLTVLPTPVEGEDGLVARLARSRETGRAVARAVRAAIAGSGPAQDPPPVVHLWTAPNRSSLWEKLTWAGTARRNGARVLLGFRNALDHWYRRWTPPERLLVRRALGKLDGILCQYSGLKEFMEEEILRGGSGTRVFVVPNGIPREEWERVGAPYPTLTPGEPLRILFLGSVVARKGVHHLVEALETVDGGGEGGGWVLDVVGPEKDPAYAEALRRKVAGAGVGDRVRFRGEIPPAERWQVLARAHLVALPSSAEGFSNVILEAMAVGRPVLATEVGAARDAILDGETGFLVPFGDLGAMTRALSGALREPMRLAAMGARARDRVLEKFEMARVTESLLEVYEALQGEAGGK